MVYPALLPLMRTPRLPVVNWIDAPADLNGFVRFAEIRNPVSARVPSHFNWPLPFLRPLLRLLARSNYDRFPDILMFPWNSTLWPLPFFGWEDLRRPVATLKWVLQNWHISVSIILLGLLETSRWDQLVVPKRRSQTTGLRRVTSRKAKISSVMKLPAHNFAMLYSSYRQRNTIRTGKYAKCNR